MKFTRKELDPDGRYEKRLQETRQFIETLTGTKMQDDYSKEPQEQPSDSHALRCVSAIAQVGGDPAIVEEMLESIKFLIECDPSECYCSKDDKNTYRCHVCATKALIAKAERKV